MQFHLPCSTFYREIIVRVSHGQNVSVKFKSLAYSIFQYVDCLDNQVKRVKFNHALPIPACNGNLESMQIKYNFLYFLYFCS